MLPLGWWWLLVYPLEAPSVPRPVRSSASSLPLNSAVRDGSMPMRVDGAAVGAFWMPSRRPGGKRLGLVDTRRRWALSGRWRKSLNSPETWLAPRLHIEQAWSKALQDGNFRTHHVVSESWIVLDNAVTGFVLRQEERRRPGHHSLTRSAVVSDGAGEGGGVLL